MVRFNKDGFTITVKTRYPIQDYLNITSGLIDLIRDLNQYDTYLKEQHENMSERPVHSLMLLKSLLPDESLAQKMAE